jgi:hypothetical protein
MPKKKSNSNKKDIDPIRAAFEVVEAAIGEALTTKVQKKKNPAAVALGRLGGLKGGKARATKLTAKERKEIARKAARERWKKLARID